MMLELHMPISDNLVNSENKTWSEQSDTQPHEKAIYVSNKQTV